MIKQSKYINKGSAFSNYHLYRVVFLCTEICIELTLKIMNSLTGHSIIIL